MGSCEDRMTIWIPHNVVNSRVAESLFASQGRISSMGLFTHFGRQSTSLANNVSHFIRHTLHAHQTTYVFKLLHTSHVPVMTDRSIRRLENANMDHVAKIRRPTRRILEWTQVYVILQRLLIHGSFSNVVCISIPRHVKKDGAIGECKLQTGFHGLTWDARNFNGGNEQSHEICSAFSSPNRYLNRGHFEHQEGLHDHPF